MSGLFSSYEEDYNDTLRQLRTSLGQLHTSVDAQQAHQGDPTRIYHPPPSTGPMSRPQQLQAAQQALAHLKDLLTSMHYEANDLDPSLRKPTKEKVDAYRKAVGQVEAEVNELRRSCTAADRADLLAFGTNRGEKGDMLDDDDAATQAQRLAGLQTTERLQSGTQTLLKAEAYLAQSNDMGRNTYSTLRQQGEQIDHIHDLTGDVDGELSQARQVMARMHRTALKHKVFLCLIILVLVLVLCLFFYLRIRG